MGGCQCGKAHNNPNKVVIKQEKKKSGNIVTLRDGFELEVAHDFFESYTKKGTVFNVRSIRHDGEKIVMKWVRSSHRCNFSKHVKYLITSADFTASILSSFKDRVNMHDWTIRVVKPIIPSGRKELAIEPHVNNLEKFNTNSFWECSTSRTYRKLILALSHFSYVASKGKYLLTNLQGGVDEKNRVITLLPPTVVSSEPGKYGCMDIGNVDKFFNHHTCNSICEDMPRRNGNKSPNIVRVVVR